jgi:hypothetical protein
MLLLLLLLPLVSGCERTWAGVYAENNMHGAGGEERGEGAVPAMLTSGTSFENFSDRQPRSPSTLLLHQPQLWSRQLS